MKFDRTALGVALLALVACSSPAPAVEASADAAAHSPADVDTDTHAAASADAQADADVRADADAQADATARADADAGAGPDAATDTGTDGGAPVLVPPGLDGKTVSVAVTCTKKTTFCHCANVAGALDCAPYAGAIAPTTDEVTFAGTVGVTFSGASKQVKVGDLPNYAAFADPAKPGYVETKIEIANVTGAPSNTSLANVPTTTAGWFGGGCGCAALAAGCTPSTSTAVKCAFPPLTMVDVTETASTADVVASHFFDVDRYNRLRQQPEAHVVGNADGTVTITLKTVFTNFAASVCGETPSAGTWFHERAATLECTGIAGP